MATLPNTQWMTWHDLGRGRHFLAKVGGSASYDSRKTLDQKRFDRLKTGILHRGLNRRIGYSIIGLRTL